MFFSKIEYQTPFLPIEQLYPSEKFQPYFTETKSSFAKSDEDYVKFIEELKKKQAVEASRSSWKKHFF